MTHDAWATRASEPLIFHYREGSYADENVESVSERYQKVLDDVCLFLDVQKSALPQIAVYLHDVLPADLEADHGPTATHLDLDNATIQTVVNSESTGAYPEFELTLLVLHHTQGPSRPDARFWEDGLAGYLAGRGGASYYSEAPDRAQKLRDEGQLRSLVNTVRQYAEHRSPVATTVAVAFATYLIEWRGGERYRRFLASVRSGDADAVHKAYGRPLTELERSWNRRMEATAQAGGGKAWTAVKGTLSFFKPYWLSLVGILITIFLALSFDLFVPQALRFVIDNVLGRRPISFTIPGLVTAGEVLNTQEEQILALFALLGLMIFMFLLNAFARLQQASMTARVSQNVVYDLRMRFLEHVQRLPIAFHSRTPANDVVQRFQTDIAYVAAVLAAGVLPMVSNGVAMLLFGFTLISLNPLLSIVALAGLPIFAFSYRQGRATMRANQRETVRRNQEIQQSVIENMSAQTLLKTWNQRPAVMERFREKLDLNRDINVRNTMITQAFARASVLITNGAQVAVLVAGGLVVIWSAGQDLSPGGLMAFYVLLLRLYGPAGLFAGAFQTLTLSADGLDRVTAILNRKEEADPPNAVTLGPLKDAIRFENAGYSPTKGKSLLKNLNLEIKSGSRIGIVGPTGAGKANLMQLLPRLADVTEGKITWDGVDMATASRESVRSQIIMMPQDTFILNLTIYENIQVGRPGASEADVVEAAKGAGLHGWVTGLPGGYDTVVSDRDTAVSTPNRQRIAAARALLRTDGSVVLMEDALSALDAGEQREIEQHLRGADGRRTIIKIAQRLGSVTDADEIVVMDGGEIVERGTHDDLLERGGLYLQLIKDELGEAAVSGAHQAVRRLGKLAPFSSLPPEVLEETARLLLYAERAPGEVLCRQGSVGDELFIIGRGEVEIIVGDDEGNERIVNVLGEGDYVGEISFLRRVPRTATVRAQTNVEVHILRRLDFDALLERMGGDISPHLEDTAQARIDDTRQKLAALDGARWEVLVRGNDCPLCAELQSTEPENSSGFFVADLALSQLRLARNQHLTGLCILVCRRHVREPYELEPAERLAYFEDMTRVGRALEGVFGAIKIDYQILGDVAPHLHCHMTPRHDGDPYPGRPPDPDRVVFLTTEEYRRRVQLIRAALE
jgi:ABC-type multidrug transport system fused ATPase/permease subunit/CRP-like cAMP-binding protein